MRYLSIIALRSHHRFNAVIGISDPHPFVANQTRLVINKEI